VRRLHRDVRALLSALDRLTAPGRLDAQLVLLEFDGKTATRIASGVQQARRNAAREHRLRDMTFIAKELGVTVMAVPPERRGSLGRDLMAYCRLKKHQHKVDAWVGFGGWAGPPEPAQLAVVLDDPWAPDDKLDRLVAELPSAATPMPSEADGPQWWRDGTWRPRR
jgi:hypothetical protein